MNYRVFIVGLLLLTVGLSHWLTPTDTYILHALHVTMRKMFLLPIVLAAIWFGLRGACLAALVATAIYIPHVLVQWQSRTAENFSQAGDTAVLWVVAFIAGWFVDQERLAQAVALDTRRGALSALVTALDARECNTERHSLRVRAYALRIGRQMRLPQKVMDVLDPASLLHDVGKIGVPDHVLLKPGPLDDRETAMMRAHPEIGYRIVRSVPPLREAAEAVYAHHEKYDGSGYPRGLIGKSTPVAARVFAVADAFDALTSNRPYRQAVGVGMARKVIQEERGRQFDPAVVDAFLRVPQGDWSRIRQGVEDESTIIELRADRVSLD